jgi:hypothetical protein
VRRAALTDEDGVSILRRERIKPEMRDYIVEHTAAQYLP